MPVLQSAFGHINVSDVADIAITALLIYWLFSLIRGTRAVRLVLGVCFLFLVYGAALAFDLRLLILILQTGAYVGLFALVVIFQPELRRALDRIGRLGSLGWLISPAEQSAVAREVAHVASAAARLSAERHGALIVLERETGLQEIAENGVMLNADVSADLLVTIFSPRTPLHDGAVVIRGGTILAAGAMLPSVETTIPLERYGTRHKAAMGITEQTDAIVVVVSEESGRISLVERARISRNLDEPKLIRALTELLHPERTRSGLLHDANPRRVAPTVRGLAHRARRAVPHRVSGGGAPGAAESQGVADDEEAADEAGISR